jgi:predicted RNase H-like HicB family nuclease
MLEADGWKLAEEVEQLMREAIPLHLESLRQHDEPIPEPHSSARYMGVS